MSKSANIAVPCKCKLCAKVIGQFAMSWPEPSEPSAAAFNRQQFDAMFQRAAEHFQQEAAVPRPSISEAVRKLNHNIQMQHAAALGHAASLGGNVTTLFLSRHLEMPPGADGFMEQVRASVNHMTSKFTLTEEYADLLATAMLDNIRQIATAMLDNTDNIRQTTGYSGETMEKAIWREIKGALLALAARYEEGHPKAGG